MLTALLLTGLSVVLVAGCGGQSSSVKSSPTPQLAPSVAATLLPDLAPSPALQPLIISVVLKDTVTLKQRARLAEEIAIMPEVQEFAFVSKKVALLRYETQNGLMVLRGPSAFPAYFEIVVKAWSDVLPVARRFFNNPHVDNDPGTHDGIAFAHSPTSP